MAMLFTPRSAIPSVHNQFPSISIRIPSAGDPLKSKRLYCLQRSQFFGEGLSGSSRFSLPLLGRSQAGCSAVRCSVPVKQRGAPRKTYSFDWYRCTLVDQALPSRSGLFLCQEQLLHTTSGRQKTWMLSCVGTSASSAAAGGMTLKPLLDQVLLLGTIFGVYIAGVASLPRLPQLFPNTGPSSMHQDAATSPKSANRNPTRKQNPKPQDPQSSGEGGWSLLQFKLSQAVSVESNEVEDHVVKSPMLGLQAIARVPRLHLLLTTLQHLRKEVDAISDGEQDLDLVQWQELSWSILSRSVTPICKEWLFQESCNTFEQADISNRVLASVGFAKPQIHMEDHVSDDARNSRQMEKNVLDSMMSILKVSESIPSYLMRSGKAGLYADLIFFLRFGSVRVGGCCDHRMFKKFTGNILEDMVVAIAEVVATLFLDCSSVASISPHGEMWQRFLLPSILSSRSLERFRNEVALYGWLNQNFTSVAAMFEDRIDLWTLQRRLIASPLQSREKSSSRKPARTRNEAGSGELILTRSQLPARRSIELKALTGWRYYYSLFLELSDVVGPLVSILISKVGDVVSFLLITLIGRSLGLVYQGIRQSVRWPTKPQR